MMEKVAKQVRVIRPTIDVDKDKRIRVAAYCRVSTESEDQANSFIAQVKYYNDFLRISANMVLVDIYADEGITGTCANKRDEFLRMMKDSKNGKIDRIYVKSVSRFARNSLECIENIRLLKSYGVSVLFENDGIDTEQMNSEMILYIKSAFAQSEALSGSKRVSMAIRMKMESGEFSTYTAPFGYKLENNKLIPIPTEAEIVRRIYNMFLSGEGFSRITAALNKDETIIGRPWGKERVRYILSNEKYIGDSLIQKTYTPCILPLRNIRNNGERDKYYIQNSHEPIIDRQTFETAQKLITKQSKKIATRNPSEHRFFTKMIYCSTCGWAYKWRKINGKAYWICSQSGTAGKQCGTHNVTERNIEQTFILFFNRLQLYRQEIVDYSLSELIAAKSQINNTNSEMSEIDMEIAELSEQNSMITRLREKEIMDEVSYQEQSAEIQRKLSSLRARRMKIIREDEEENCIEELRILKEQLTEMPKALLRFEREIFKMLVKRIVIDPNDVMTFELLCGLKLKETVKWN